MASVVWNFFNGEPLPADDERRICALDVPDLTVGLSVLLEGTVVVSEIGVDTTAYKLRYRRNNSSGAQIGPTFFQVASVLEATAGAIIFPPVFAPPGAAADATFCMTVEPVGASDEGATSYALLKATYGDVGTLTD